ncbi:unnamed protein product [Peronospora farinosa]|nr:unnamed protein product [Peronospora farinosa]
METTLAKLLTVGLVSIKPWPGSHWATYKDSINAQLYQGEPPTSAKYALAFGFDVKDFMDKISKDVGIDVHRPDKTKCEIDTDCKFFNDDRVCAIRTGHHSGYWIPTWWGICHAWSSAAILEQEPKCPVTYNNITFSPLELKGLLLYIYNDRTLSTVSAGVRFNGDDDTDVKDEYGSSESFAFRDMNPGLVHIVLANIVGKLGKSVIMDVTAGSRVHNQPYPWNANVKSIVYMKTRLTWVAETSDEGPLLSKGKADIYTEGYVLIYLLEMDGAGKIIGGEWLFDSKNPHPDFMYIPTSKLPADLVRPKGMRHADVSMLLEKSVACSDTQ